MTTTTCPGTAQAAADILQPLASFDRHKGHSQRWAARWGSDPRATEMAATYSHCAEALGLLLTCEPGEAVKAQLQNAYFCRSRFCPFCEWRRSVRWRRRLIPGLEKFHQEHPTHKAVFLTLTARNVPLAMAREAVMQLHKGWYRLYQRAAFPTPYWVRRTEITIGRPPSDPDSPGGGQPPASHAATSSEPAAESPATFPDKGSNSSDKPIRYKLTSSNEVENKKGPAPERGPWNTFIHPHIHAMLLVPASYFGKGYISQRRWTELWMDAMRLDYQPIVDIRRAKGKESDSDALKQSIRAAIEAVKYTAKPSDVMDAGPLVPELTKLLKYQRTIAVSHALRRFVSDAEVIGDEMTDGPEMAIGSEFGAYVTAAWNEATAHYEFTP